MNSSLKEIIIKDLKISADHHISLIESDEVHEKMLRIATSIANTMKKNSIVFFAGNGGSFADAQHLAAEFIGTMGKQRRSLPAIAVGTNSSSATAISNDIGFESIFTRELTALANKDSTIIFLTTSGNSKNIINSATQLLETTSSIYAFTGENSNSVGELVECVMVPSSRTERIQEMHILIGHIICYLVEEILKQEKYL
jgi:D-sedoheptulose 7-phosphate isomerase